MFPVKDTVRDAEHQCPMVPSLVSVPILQSVHLRFFWFLADDSPLLPMWRRFFNLQVSGLQDIAESTGHVYVPLDLQSLLPLEICLTGLGGVHWHRLEGVTVQCLICHAAMAALEYTHNIHLFEMHAVLLAFWFHYSQKTPGSLGLRWACGTTVTCVSIGLLWEITLHTNLRSCTGIMFGCRCCVLIKLHWTGWVVAYYDNVTLSAWLTSVYNVE